MKKKKKKKKKENEIAVCENRLEKTWASSTWNSMTFSKNDRFANRFMVFVNKQSWKQMYQ